MKQKVIPEVIEIINDLKKYWPMSLRQIYYQLVTKGIIENCKNEYNMLSKKLTDLRENEKLSWGCMEDRTRKHISNDTYSRQTSVNEFISNEIYNLRYAFEGLFDGYHRNTWATQTNKVEVWIEKEALSSVISSVCANWNADLVISKGYTSTTFKHECKQRILRNKDINYKILYFGDLDPSGVNIFDTLEEYLNDLDNLTIKRIALTEEQVEQYNLPHDKTKIKKEDARSKKYKYNIAVELDALQPDLLEELVEESIKKEVDLSKIKEEEIKEEEEREYLETLKEQYSSSIDEAVDKINSIFGLE